MNSTKWDFYTFLIFLHLLVLPCFVCSIDTITPNKPIKDGDVLVSGGTKRFALGFFSPGSSRNRYVGIWYNKVPGQTVVWVANRDSPVSDTSGILAINVHGGLAIYWKNQTAPLWSANVTLTSPENSTAKLLDTGNLVLLQSNGSSSSQRVLWEGFDHLSNTRLPVMKLGLDRRTGLNRSLTSWKSMDDPGTGNCSFWMNPSGMPQLFIYKDGAPWWRTGSWTGERWSGVPQMTNYIFNTSYVDNEDELSVVYRSANESILSMMVLHESGTFECSTWNDQVHQWIKVWSAPTEECDSYRKCGPNSNCDPYNDGEFECTCLPGFEPKLARDWFLRDGSGGCVRRTGVSVCQSGEGFVKVPRVKVPESSMARVNVRMNLKACEDECMRNCSCTAYGNADDRQGGTGCVTWYGDLLDTRTYSNVGQDLYVRVDAVTLAQYTKKPNGSSLGKKGKLTISVVSALAFLLLFALGCWLGKRRKDLGKASFCMTSSTYAVEESPARTNLEESRIDSDLPFFELRTIARATNNFSVDNKLGEGGFGSVYKGVLYNGEEIAVKRLAKNSGQGIEEFRNEVVLIAKLQHKNLVRIVGWCLQGEEKMLIYEYLPNKSLDSFIFFNETNKALLDWKQRSEIICGIARGMLYLHQDSRLRIIHRDLKASNVLLDSAMNPKIADFGMARIFGATQMEANTNRVVGTYGYMSPEYAMEGKFSVKSDVYSFGVLLLEIVTGRKNTAQYRDYPDSNLVGHVWDLWKAGRALAIIDPSVGESYPAGEVLRCIQIALLCVQEHATDRPTMSTVVFMLENDAAVPSPRQPGFLLRRSHRNSSGEPTTSNEGYSINDVTCTEIEPR